MSRALCEMIAQAVRRGLHLKVRRPGCYITSVVFSIELEREEDGRWLAEVPACPASCATASTAMKPLLAFKRWRFGSLPNAWSTGKRLPSF